MKMKNADPSYLFSESSNSAGAGIERAVRLGSIVWILAIQFFVAQIVVQSAWVTPFSLMQNFISDLGNTICGPYPAGSSNYVCSPWHVWMNLSFVALGLIILFGGALIHMSLPMLAHEKAHGRAHGFLFLFFLLKQDSRG